MTRKRPVGSGGGGGSGDHGGDHGGDGGAARDGFAGPQPLGCPAAVRPAWPGGHLSTGGRRCSATAATQTLTSGHRRRRRRRWSRSVSAATCARVRRARSADIEEDTTADAVSLRAHQQRRGHYDEQVALEGREKGLFVPDNATKEMMQLLSSAACMPSLWLQCPAAYATADRPDGCWLRAPRRNSADAKTAHLRYVRAGGKHGRAVIA